MDTVIMADPVSCLSTNLFPPPFLLIESWILQESNEPSWAMYPNCSKPVFNNPVPIWQKLNSHTSLQLNTATWSIWVSLRLLDFFLFFFFFYLFMAVLGLHFCVRAFSSCGKWGPLFIAVRGPLTVVASLVAEHRLQTRRLSNCGSRA